MRASFVFPPSVCVISVSFRTGLAFFKIYFGLVYVVCARTEAPTPDGDRSRVSQSSIIAAAAND